MFLLVFQNFMRDPLIQRQKGSWGNYYLKADKVIHTEPYRLPNFYKGKISLGSI